MLAWVDRALVWAFDLGLSPLLALPPLAGLLVVSLATAVVMLLVVARTSNQAGIIAAKRGIHAALFEIRLYGDDLGLVARALGDVLWQNGRYLGFSLVPLAWMLIPVTLVVAQLQAFYGYAGLTPGEAAIITVTLRQAPGQPDEVTLEAPAGIRVDTPAVSLAASPEVLWRIVPTAAGEYMLTIRADGHSETKSLLVSERPARRSPWRGSTGLVDRLLYPSEPPLPGDSPFAAITVAYPAPGVDVLGWRMHWMIVYIVLTMAGAWLMARRFGVTI